MGCIPRRLLWEQGPELIFLPLVGQHGKVGLFEMEIAGLPGQPISILQLGRLYQPSDLLFLAGYRHYHAFVSSHGIFDPDQFGLDDMSLQLPSC